jgi:hypothetical protein
MREPVLALALATGIAIVAACAAVEPYKAMPGPQASNASLYCWKDRLVEEQDRLVCNWAPTRYDACNGHAISYVARSTVKSAPAQVTRCENGQSLVVVTTG